MFVSFVGLICWGLSRSASINSIWWICSLETHLSTYVNFVFAVFRTIS